MCSAHTVRSYTAVKRHDTSYNGMNPEDMKRREADAKSHISYGSFSMKCSEQAHPWTQKADRWFQELGGREDRLCSRCGVLFWKDANVLELEVVVTQSCEDAKYPRNCTV